MVMITLYARQKKRHRSYSFFDAIELARRTDCKYCFLNFTFYCLWPVYRNTVDLYILILCSVTLLNSFMRSSSFFFFLRFLGIAYTEDQLVLRIKTILLFSDMHLISFSCLSGLARISSTILMANGESRSCCLILELMGEAFSLSQLGIFTDLVNCRLL